MINEPLVKKLLSSSFNELGEQCKKKQLTVKELLELVGVDGHAFVALVLCFPFLLPIPLPGLSVVFGLLIAASGLGIALNIPILLPKWFTKRNVPTPIISKVFFHSASVLKKVEKLLKPRFLFLFSIPFIRFFMGLMVTLCGLVLFLPLPPGTNFPPAIICVCMVLSLLEKDGLVFLIGITLFVGITWFGFAFADIALDYFFPNEMADWQ
jgi:hypothetical protein